MRRLAMLVALATAPGCDDQTWPGGAPVFDDSDTDEASADWATVQTFFAQHCVQCHPEGSAVLVLPDGIAADVADTSADPYVVAGDPAESKLWRVISGELEGAEMLMPLGSSEPLPHSEIWPVYFWIRNGAVID